MQQRYLTQLLEIGADGQEKLAKSRVLAIGCGGLAAITLPYLVAAGIGSITLFDGDIVEESNLTRQIFFTNLDVGANKAKVLGQRLLDLNPNVKLTIYSEYFNLEYGQQLVNQHDLVIDLSDTYGTKVLINYLCQQFHKSWIYASVLKWDGQVAAFAMQGVNSPCYKCLLPKANIVKNGCKQNGVVGAAVGVVASTQALLVLHTLLGVTSHQDVLHVFDLWNITKHEFKLSRNGKCKFHGDLSSIPMVKYRDLVKILNLRLIDVRSKSEWEQGSLFSAEHLDLSEIMSRPHELFTRTQNIVIFCHGQTISDLVVEFLVENDFNAFSLQGGFNKVKKSKNVNLH